MAGCVAHGGADRRDRAGGLRLNLRLLPKPGGDGGLLCNIFFTVNGDAPKQETLAKAEKEYKTYEGEILVFAKGAPQRALTALCTS